jgi:AraC-like DNA-binding protein
MENRPMFLPAATARALLAGLRALGLDAEAIRREAGIDPSALRRFDAALEVDRFGRLWQGAFRRAPRAELPTEVGLAIPFGAFGSIDYLARSSSDVEAAFHALASHLRQVATRFQLEVAGGDSSGGLISLVWPQGTPERDVSDEFTVAVFIGRFRASGSGPFPVSAVRLTRAPPERPGRHAELLRARVAFGCSVSAIELPEASWKLPMRHADPALQETLRQLAEHLELGATSSDLETAVRARLRSLLPDGGPSAAAIARALGMAERTLQRKLHGAGTSFMKVLDAFREAEAERLLEAGVPLAEVALRLGFSDQTAWNRAFKRWKGQPPRQWASAHGAGGAPARPGARR